MIMVLKQVLSELRRKWLHLRLRPIRVFLFHQVGEVFDPSVCKASDWTQIEQFKANIMEIKKYYAFISINEAFKHLRHDYFRVKRYAVLTSDDGAASLKTILPWLKEQGVPITLFINGKYLDGVSYRSLPSESYLTEKELLSLDYDGIEIGHHGWEHNDLTQIGWQQFIGSVERNSISLKRHPRYVPFWAYTWGRHTNEHDAFLLSKGIIPVSIDGMKNYKEQSMIHRELLDGKRFEELGVR